MSLSMLRTYVGEVPGVTFSEVAQPVGAITIFAGKISTAAFAGPHLSPTEAMGWMLCDGRSLKVADYPELFSALGYLYGGSGDTFHIPNLTGQFLRGVGSTAGSLENRQAPPGGSAQGVGSTQLDALQTHQHQYTAAQASTSGGATGSTDAIAISDQYTTPPKQTQGTTPEPHISMQETRPTNTFVYFLIKYTYHIVREASHD